MPTPFARTLRSIRSDGFRPSTTGALAAALALGAWTAWLVLARVDVLEVCPGARVEARGALVPIEARAGGTVLTARLELGRAVRAGDVLVELDPAALGLEEAEERERAAAAEAELAALGRQRAAEELAAAETAPLALAALEESRLRRAEHELSLSLANEEVSRLEQLESGGIVSELDLVRARGAVRSRELALELHDASELRRAGEERRATAERDARLVALARETERQRGISAAARARLERLAHERGELTILAPRDGVLAERRELAAGARLEAGDRVAALVASGELSVVAELEPSAALGRVAPGQRAELRLDGFPWSRHGTLGLRVARVAGEPRDGKVRVELDIVRATSIPLQHGLPGTLEVVVERVSPAELLLRGAGLAALARAGDGASGAVSNGAGSR